MKVLIFLIVQPLHKYKVQSTEIHLSNCPEIQSTKLYCSTCPRPAARVFPFSPSPPPPFWPAKKCQQQFQTNCKENVNNIFKQIAKKCQEHYQTNCKENVNKIIKQIVTQMSPV